MPSVCVTVVWKFPVKFLNLAEIKLLFALLAYINISDHDVFMNGGSKSLLPKLCLQRKWLLIMAGISWGRMLCF